MMASHTSTVIPITLRPSRAPDLTSDALPQRVQRIATQRDGLKNVTEAKLLEEIAEDAAGVEKASNEVDDDEKSKDTLTQQKELWGAKAELLTHIDQLQNPVAMALDLLSLQIRDQVRAQADQTLSAFVKGAMPVGGMGLAKLEPQAPDPKSLETDTVVATGWSLQNLHRSADRLLQSAQSLNREVEKETRYWREVSEVKRKGWSVARIPRQRNTVGVKFGFSEAGPLFQTQSLAALRANEDGRIILDRGLMREHKSMRVRIVENERVLGESRGVAGTAEGSDIESRIHQARDSLFEDELFYEMTCEARELLAYNVKILDDAIRIPVPSTDSQARYLIVSLEPVDAPSSHNQTASADGHAHAIALACRVLLTHTYRQRFRRRSRPPPPLSDDKQKTRKSEILRPLLNFLHHRAAVARLTGFATSISAALTAADVPFSYRLDIPRALLSSSTNTPMEVLVESMLKPHETSLSLVLGQPEPKNAGSTITVRTTTALSDPTYGTMFHVMLEHPTPSSDGSQVRADIEFDDINTLLTSLRRMICVRVAAGIAEQQERWKQGPESKPELMQNEETRNDRRRLVLAIQDDQLILAGGLVGGKTGVAARWPGSASNLLQTISKM